jgi:hypothetical protein
MHALLLERSQTPIIAGSNSMHKQQTLHLAHTQTHNQVVAIVALLQWTNDS